MFPKRVRGFPRDGVATLCVCGQNWGKRLDGGDDVLGLRIVNVGVTSKTLIILLDDFKFMNVFEIYIHICTCI